MATQLYPLYRFAYIDLSNHLQQLAQLAEYENWNGRYAPNGRILPVLYNYIHYTFTRLEQEHKIEYSNDNACVNLGLWTPNEEEIFILFEKNHKGARSQWRFAEFCITGAHKLNAFSSYPKRAEYFSDPTNQFFDPKLNVVPNLAHIVDSLREKDPQFRGDNLDRSRLQAAINSTIERIRRNYTQAIPQYHDDELQWLLPLSLTKPPQANWAMVAQKTQNGYRISTVLSLADAYNNARLVGRPRDWLAM